MKRTAGLLENQMAAVVSKHVLEGLYSLHFFLFHKGLCGMWHGSQTQNSCKKKQKKPKGYVGGREGLLEDTKRKQNYPCQ